MDMIKSWNAPHLTWHVHWNFIHNFTTLSFLSDLNWIFLRYGHSTWRKKETVSWRFCKICLRQFSVRPPVVTRNQLGCNGDGYDSTVQYMCTVHLTVLQCCSKHCSGARVAQSEWPWPSPADSSSLPSHWSVEITWPEYWPLIGQ